MFITGYATDLILTSEYSDNVFLRMRGDRSIGTFLYSNLVCVGMLQFQKELAIVC